MIASLALDDPNRVRKAEVFTGSFPPLRSPQNFGSAKQSNLLLKDTLTKLRMLLSGYELGPGVLKKCLQNLMKALRDPSLPLQQFKELISTVSGRIPQQIFEELSNIAGAYGHSISHNRYLDC